MKRPSLRQIRIRLERILDRYLEAPPEERVRLVLEKMRLEEDLELLTQQRSS